jgi:hypothetical protein
MEKLNLPIINAAERKKKALLMDEYVEFVMFHLKHTYDKKASDWWKKKKRVKQRFVLQ